jgi:hypothetical protein
MDFWLALDKERGTHVGFGEAWVEYRAVLIEREAQERALATAAFGDRDDAYDPEEIIARDRYDNAPDR